MTKLLTMVCALALAGTAGVAVADQWEMNGIKGNMASAEDRFKTGNLDNSRFFVNQVKAAMDKAAPDTRAMLEYAKIAERLKALESKLGKAEGDASTTEQADMKLDEANSYWMNAKSLVTSDPDTAIKDAEICIQKAEEAFKIDPKLRTRTTRLFNIPGEQVLKECQEAAAKAKKFNSGEGKERAADHKWGKPAIVAFNAAFKAWKSKDADAFVVVEGQKAAEDCITGYDQVTSIMLNSAKHYYDEATEMMPTDAGKLSLKDFGLKCRSMQAELRNRKASGCGFKNVMVQQELIGKNKWGSLETYAPNIYTPGKCGEMPKSHKWAGSSGSFAGNFKKACGGGAIFVITEGAWHTWDSNGKTNRSIDGVCWEKGKLAFGTGGASVAH